MCEACERGDHANCGLQTWCACECDPENVWSYTDEPDYEAEAEKWNPDLCCDQCGKPQRDDGSGLCSWRACDVTGSCDGRQVKVTHCSQCNATLARCPKCGAEWCLDHQPNPLVCPGCGARQ